MKYEHLISCIPSHQEAIDVGLLDQLSLDDASRNKVITLPETNQNAPENRPGPKKEIHLPSNHFQGGKWFWEKKHLENWSGVKCS